MTKRREPLGKRITNAGIGGAGYLFARFATHPPRLPVYHRPNEAFPTQEITFLSRDGLRLSGWFVAAKEAKGGVVLCHGHPGTRMETLDRAKWLYEAGFHVLLFDFRALGRSEGTVSGIGCYEVQDLLGAVDILLARAEMASLPLGVYGHSMGGAVSLLTAAQDPRIEAVATHGAYATLESAIRQRAKLLAHGFAPTFEESVTRYGKQWLPIDPKALAPQEAIAKIAPRPLLLFHGAKDKIIALEDAYTLYEAAGEPKQLHILTHSYHIGIHPSEQEKYRDIFTRFYTSAFAKTETSK